MQVTDLSSYIMVRKACIIDGITFWHIPTDGITLGQQPDSSLLSIDDNQRTSGLYILGKPRMGKSWLMVNMILQDFQNGHGVFFLDPHGDAIDNLLQHLNSLDLQSTILLDPEDPHYSFGINLLECKNIADIKARNDAILALGKQLSAIYVITALLKTTGLILVTDQHASRKIN